MTAEITPVEKLAAITRELGYRRYVYPRRVADGRMQQAAADRQIAIMEAIEADYREIVAKDRLL
jgi:hypothetical protein